MLEKEQNELRKADAKELLKRYKDRLTRSQRMYLGEPAAALVQHRDVEFQLKRETAEFFCIPFRRVAFAGSAQLGFSVVKDRPFVEKESDLDVACISSELFQKAWVDVIEATQAFSNNSVFGGLRTEDIELFKSSILRRGMIRIEIMPKTTLAETWRAFESVLTMKNRHIFKKVSVAIYINEYAFCWKQDSVLSKLIGARS
jgi:hypothetical protein